MYSFLLFYQLKANARPLRSFSAMRNFLSYKSFALTESNWDALETFQKILEVRMALLAACFPLMFD